MSDGEEFENRWNQIREVVKQALHDGELDLYLAAMQEAFEKSSDPHHKRVATSLHEVLKDVWLRDALEMWNGGDSWSEVYFWIEDHLGFISSNQAKRIRNHKALQAAVIRYAEEYDLPIRRGKTGRPSKRK